MPSNTYKEWIAAAKQHVADPSAAMLCPNCHKDYLRAQDLVYKSIKSETRLYCPTCGAQNFLSYARTEKADSHADEGETSEPPSD